MNLKQMLDNLKKYETDIGKFAFITSTTNTDSTVVNLVRGRIKDIIMSEGEDEIWVYMFEGNRNDCYNLGCIDSRRPDEVFLNSAKVRECTKKLIEESKNFSDLGKSIKDGKLGEYYIRFETFPDMGSFEISIGKFLKATSVRKGLEFEPSRHCSYNVKSLESFYGQDELDKLLDEVEVYFKKHILNYKGKTKSRRWL